MLQNKASDRNSYCNLRKVYANFNLPVFNVTNRKLHSIKCYVTIINVEKR
jgi:hypothetical protein